MRDPDGYLIEVGQYSQTSIDNFRQYLAETEEPRSSAPLPR